MLGHHRLSVFANEQDPLKVCKQEENASWTGVNTESTLELIADDSKESKKEDQILTAKPARRNTPAGFLCEPRVPAHAPYLANPNPHRSISDRTTPRALFAQLRWLSLGTTKPLVAAAGMFSPSSVWFLFFQQFVVFFDLRLAFEGLSDVFYE